MLKLSEIFRNHSSLGRFGQLEFRRSERGATFVEFTLAGLVFLIVLLGAIELSRIAYNAHLVQHMLNESSRKLILGRIPDADLCPAPPNQITADCRARSIAKFLRDLSTGLQFTVTDETYFRICTDVEVALPTAADYDCECCFFGVDLNCSGSASDPMNTVCDRWGLTTSVDPSQGDQYSFVGITHFARTLIIDVPIESGVVVRNEPFEND